MNHGCTAPINQTISEVQFVSKFVNFKVLSLSEKAGESEPIAARCWDV